MSLATRCPQCQTLFKVSSGQLQLHEGKVRCGQCESVFSGIDHLTSADTEMWQQLDLNPKAHVSDHHLAGGDGTQSETLFANTSTDFTAIKPWFDFSQGSLALKAICSALLLTIVLQTAWWQRKNWLELSPTLLAQINQARPSIQALFAKPATQTVVVAGSSLQSLDEHRVRVDLTLHNTHGLPAAWPHLKIDLLDPQGLIVASKRLNPNDYQLRSAGAASQAPPISGKKTIEVLAYLDLSKLNVQLPESVITGFRLELFDHGLQVP